MERTAVKKLSREEQAKLEIGQTEISFSQSLALTLFVFFGIAVLPFIQLMWEKGNTKSNKKAIVLDDKPIGVIDAITTYNSKLLSQMQDWEVELEDRSILKYFFLKPLQEVFVHFLGVGNEKGYLGRKGWLYYRPDLEYLTIGSFLEPSYIQQRLNFEGGDLQPDPVLGILSFYIELEKRGIELVILPIPVKTGIHPENFSSRFESSEQALQNTAFKSFLQELKDPQVFFNKRYIDLKNLAERSTSDQFKRSIAYLSENRNHLEKDAVHVFIPDRDLVLNKRLKKEKQYLKTDTHWTSQSMDHVAEKLSKYLKNNLLPEKNPDMKYMVKSSQINGQGDIATMLKLGRRDPIYGTEKERVEQVLRNEQEYWHSEKDAEILLLGDSFSNIYSRSGMGWGEAAGFAEHLSYHLSMPLDTIIQNDAGSYATRAALSKELRRGSPRLKTKKILIWEFACRELAFGNWKFFPLTLGEASQSEFFVPKNGREVLVDGIVEMVSSVPKPGSVPYKDHVIALHLVGMQGVDREIEQTQALVYLFSMENNQWLDAAYLRSGDQIRLKLRPWESVEDKYGSMNRAELDDEELELEEPCWGEVIK